MRTSNTQRPRLLDRACLVLCVAVLGATVLYPSLWMLFDAVRIGDFSVLASATGRAAVLNTLVISLLSVLFSGLLGTGLALVLHRYSFPGRDTLSGLAYLPLALPPLVGTLAFYYIIGRDGFLVRLLGVEVPGPAAILVVHTYSFFVYFYAMVLSALERLDRSLIEAARTLGASPWRAFTRVTLPLLLPALSGAALLVFMSSAASFSAPYFFGEGYPVLAVEVFNARSNYQNGAALSFTVLLAAISLLGVLVFRDRGQAAAGGSKGTRTTLRGRSRAAAGALAWGGAVLLLLPHFCVLAFAFADHRAWQDEIFPTQYSLANFTTLFTDASAFTPIRNSLWASVIATATALLLALPAAYLLGRRRVGHRLVEVLVMLPWALPGTVIAINLIGAFNHDWLPLYNTVWLLPLAYFVRAVPMAARMLTAAVAPFDATLIEAARTLGARPAYVFWRVVLPLIAPSVLAAGALVFATSLGEFVASILLYVPDNVPIAVHINMEWRSSAGPAFAYSVLLMLLVAAAFIASRRLTQRVL